MNIIVLESKGGPTGTRVIELVLFLATIFPPTPAVSRERQSEKVSEWLTLVPWFLVTFLINAATV